MLACSLSKPSTTLTREIPTLAFRSACLSVRISERSDSEIARPAISSYPLLISVPKATFSMDRPTRSLLTLKNLWAV